MSADTDGLELFVDGEQFRVHTSDDGMTHCDWLTGPNSGYGFSVGRPVTFVPAGAAPPADVALRTDELLIQSIREFLAGINPETGYLD